MSFVELTLLCRLLVQIVVTHFPATRRRRKKDELETPVLSLSPFEAKGHFMFASSKRGHPSFGGENGSDFTLAFLKNFRGNWQQGFAAAKRELSRSYPIQIPIVKTVEWDQLESVEMSLGKQKKKVAKAESIAVDSAEEDEDVYDNTFEDDSIFKKY